MKSPTTLIIMDGFGLSDNTRGNAVYSANTPILDALMRDKPHTRLSASGTDVGLPPGTMGNSEVGHTNIGAGRVVYQSLLRISNSVEDGSFFKNKVFTDAADDCRASASAAHLLMLMSDAGVHSEMSHLFAMLKLLKDRGLTKIYIHCFMDGRDTSPTSGRSYIESCMQKCTEIGAGKIATITGRFYAMDRDKRWDRVEKAYNLLAYGDGTFSADPIAAVTESYRNDVTDEFIEPVICDREGIINSGDTVFFMNFRPDRAREITRAFADPDFDGFKRKNGYFRVNFICATEYDASMPNVKVAFPPEFPAVTFGEFISKLGMKQLRIAETEKYAHVTFFFNGGSEVEFPGEDRVLIPSPKDFPTYDLIPQMCAYEVAEAVCKRIRSGQYDVIIVNFANCDMVGHTGNFSAVLKAVEAVDECVGMVVEATKECGGVSIVTADHGNAEKMLEDDGISPFTAHSTNYVPFIICGADVTLREGRLCDITPTMLDLMGLEKPPEMTGESLIV